MAALVDPRHFRTPQTANGDAQGHSMGVKLVGQIVHGQLFVFYLVPQWVSDDANLVTTLLLRTQELSIEVRWACIRVFVGSFAF